MSEPLFPLAVWQSGTNENSLPANDNALRVEAFNRNVISRAVTAQPASPADGDVYILATTHTGAQWAEFSPDDLVIYRDGTWYAFTPVEGVVVNNNGTLYEFAGSAGWAEIAGGSGGADRSGVTNVSSASGVVTLDYNLGDYFTLTLTENVTSWIINNPPGSGHGFSLMVQITQDSTPRTVAKPGTTAGGAALGVSTGAGAVDVLAITSFDNGATLRSTIAKAFS
jgi:hypothetical protein